ncbi:MAG: recombination protein NinG [Atlantibacter hermannii]|uniref:recombination protein NinG n=1 Tax=Atlantibacter hermannii TaxID=565 RepID=UPI00290600F9|nr:recombination protein NinG [Atlantibacter hermannii]MDU7812106.1 recombination protein NinG [Atlantibacter hermannii]
MVKARKPPKPKKCKCCPEKFIPRTTTQTVCSPKCSLLLAKQLSSRKQKQQEKAERAAWNKRKADVKPLKHWEDATQRVVNDYIRERDRDLPCISCGTWITVQWEAGHFRSRGAASHLRYNEDNIHKQCHRCNAELSSNAIPYRAALVVKIGPERVEALENNNTPHRYTREELKSIRMHYRALMRELIKTREEAA